MALERTIINLNFAQGLQTQPDPKQIQPGELLEAVNVTFETPGQLTKRDGSAAITSSITGGGTIGAVKTFSGQEGGLFAGDGVKAYHFGGQSWLPAGYMPTGTAALHSVGIVSNTTSGVDAAWNVANDEVCVAWTASDGSAVGSQEYAVFRYSTGALLGKGRISTVLGSLRVVAVASRFVILLGDVNNRLVRFWEIACGAPATLVDRGAPVTAGMRLSDAMVFGTTVYAGGRHDAGVGDATVQSLDAANATASRQTADVVNASYELGILRNSAGVMLCYVTGANLRAAVFNDALSATVSAATTLTALAAGAIGSGAIALGALSGARTRVVWPDGATSATQLTFTMTTTDALTPSAPSVRSVYRYAVPRSRGWVDASDNLFVIERWFGTLIQVGLNPSYITMIPDDNSNHSLVATLANEVTGSYFSRGITYSGGVALFGTSDAIGTIQFVSAGTAFDITQYSAQYMAFDQASPVAPSALASGSLHVPSGQLWQSDGVNVVEHGFPILPAPPTLAQVAAVGHLADGDYLYRYCYMWVDADGIQHRSAPSAATKITIAAGGGVAAVDVTMTPPNWSNRTMVIVEIYRTLLAGTLYYECTSGQTTPPLDIPIIRDLSTDSGATAITGHRQLYTNDGTLENIEVPLPTIVVQHRDRMWAVSALQPTTLWYSKPIFPGVAVEWSDVQTQAVPTGDEPLTGIGSLDDKMAIFTKNRAFYVVGQGPGINGLNNDLQVYPLVSAQGCVNQASIGTIPEGLVFRSPKGWYLLDRGMGLSYIGSNVEAYNASLATSTFLASDTRQLRITLDSANVLCFNYNQKQWSTHAVPAAYVGSALYGSRWATATAAGVFAVENPGGGLDYQGSNVNVRVATGWISFSGLQNFERVRRMMLLFDPNASTHSTLSVSIAYDFDDTVVQTETITTAQLQGTAEGAQVLVHLTRQKCDSLKVTIQEVNASGDPDLGVRLSGLAFEVGVKRGLRKLPATRTV